MRGSPCAHTAQKGRVARFRRKSFPGQDLRANFGVCDYAQYARFPLDRPRLATAPEDPGVEAMRASREKKLRGRKSPQRITATRLAARIERPALCALCAPSRGRPMPQPPRFNFQRTSLGASAPRPQKAIKRISKQKSTSRGRPVTSQERDQVGQLLGRDLLLQPFGNLNRSAQSPHLACGRQRRKGGSGAPASLLYSLIGIDGFSRDSLPTISCRPK